MTDDEPVDGTGAIMQLLCGYSMKNGRMAIKYLDHNSPQEWRARKHLAERVRKEMHGFVGELLALAIDPRTPSPGTNMQPARRVKFESPARGKGSTWVRDIRIVEFIRNELASISRDMIKRGEQRAPKLEAAIAAAVKRYGIKRSRGHKIWRNGGFFRKILLSDPDNSSILDNLF